ncbi:indole-3-glycerol phosphate synthase TrpC [Bacillus massiliigorillae]|uniref:indole-3-glycerol phosphate synthase TrpC n=1 Tax=Bacillus massiliigorillae TaxID=1243664 RepID=UPI0003A8EE8F|nr:indole-3-glycerol phosphate synthase TrpC [Bacillus massiliigorillae]
MSSILQRILDEKINEVERLKQESIPDVSRTPISLQASIRAKAPIGIIAEIKRHSPSKGALHENVNPVEQAKQYELAGAAAISVLTDEPFFKGRFEDLAAVREAVSIPILCKDFIIDPIQIKKAKSVGADVILLIVAALSQERLQALYMEAKQQGLEVLVEVHDEEELQRAVEIGAEIIGVNNRNLLTFDVSLTNTERIARSSLLTNQLLISESGIVSREDVQVVKQAGANGILVGETLMKSSNIAKTIHELSLRETEATL